MKILFKTPLSRSFLEIRKGFTKDLFTHLSPQVMPFEIERFDGCTTGDEIQINIGPSGFQQKWISIITFEETNEKGWSFIDEGKVLPWPISYWKHHHRVDKVGANESVIVDNINYRCSPRMMEPLLWPLLFTVFSLRPSRYRSFFKA